MTIGNLFWYSGTRVYKIAIKVEYINEGVRANVYFSPAHLSKRNGPAILFFRCPCYYFGP